MENVRNPNPEADTDSQKGLETGKIFVSVRRTCLLRYISYGGKRLRKQTAFRLIPEIALISRLFGPRTLNMWHQSMRHHNQILKRGERLTLCPIVKVKKLMHSSLDMYILQMHSEKIAKALQSLTAFGERVKVLICQDPTARVWWLHRDMLIQRRHWVALSQHVMNLVSSLGLHELNDHAPPPHHPWPDYDALRAAAKDAARIFGPFVGSDGHCPPPAALLRTFPAAGGERQDSG